MIKKYLKEHQGFTLIEIVLVLAIAGLLLVVVFLAVGGAQRARRDSQRKNDLARITSLIESYASNTNGCYPGSTAATGCAAAGTWAAFSISPYITGANLVDPLSGTAYTYVGAATPTPAAAMGMAYTYGTDCAGAAGRSYNLRANLEAGNICHDNK
jgi:prepilin-type N-terminal cleavage/methylation domain-containing protein